MYTNINPAKQTHLDSSGFTFDDISFNVFWNSDAPACLHQLIPSKDHNQQWMNPTNKYCLSS